MKAQLISVMGSDDSIADAARVSFDKRAEMYTPEQNQSLIKYLARGVSTKDYEQLVSDVATGMTPTEARELVHQIKNQAVHWTPFAHTAISMRMSAPVPIRTQCFKHKQGFVENEESRRYISSVPELYIPEYIRAKPEGSIKQGSGDRHPNSDKWLQCYRIRCAQILGLYEDMIEDGVCPEQARFILPQGVCVNWIWTGSLYAFANFYNKRTDTHAQKEIQDLAHQVGKLIAPHFPVAWSALTNRE